MNFNVAEISADNDNALRQMLRGIPKWISSQETENGGSKVLI